MLSRKDYVEVNGYFNIWQLHLTSQLCRDHLEDPGVDGGIVLK